MQQTMKMKNKWIGALLLAMFATQLAAQDTTRESTPVWPQWRGPTWNGVASEANPPVKWSETENLAWKTPIPGSGHGTPIVWGDRIFLQTAIPLDMEMPIPDVVPPGTPNMKQNPGESIGTWTPQRFAIVCLDRASGKPLWTRKVLDAMPHQGHHHKGAFAAQSSVTDGKHVYAYFGSYGLYCYDFEGRLVWKKDFQPQALEAGLGEGSSPALFENTLVIVVDQESQSFVVAIDKTTGNEIWRQDRDEPSNWNTPRIFTHDGRDQVIINGVKARSYDLPTGELLWECGGHTAGAVPMPAIGHGMAFTASGWQQDVLQAIKLGQRGDLTDSEHVIWKLRRGTPYVPSPMLWGDEIYLLEDRSFFSCLNATDGKPHYFKQRLPGALNFSASPVGAADRIYLLSEEGKTVVVQRGPELKVLAVNELDESFHASPAIVGEAIYLRGDKHLYCFRKLTR
jgi:outer membrane protein assembly factor BamB